MASRSKARDSRTRSPPPSRRCDPFSRPPSTCSRPYPAWGVLSLERYLRTRPFESVTGRTSIANTDERCRRLAISPVPMKVMWACSPPRVSKTTALYAGSSYCACSFVIRFQMSAMAVRAALLLVVASQRALLRRRQWRDKNLTAPLRRSSSAPVMP
jgi:hypothetical protein